MGDVLRDATILLEASHVPATLATLLVLMQEPVLVSELWKSGAMQLWFIEHSVKTSWMTQLLTL